MYLIPPCLHLNATVNLYLHVFGSPWNSSEPGSVLNLSFWEFEPRNMAYPITTCIDKRIGNENLMWTEVLEGQNSRHFWGDTLYKYRIVTKTYQRTISEKHFVSYEGLSLRGRGQGFSSANMNVGPGYFQRKTNRRKIESKETRSCLIPRLLVVLFIRQLEILVTTLFIYTCIQDRQGRHTKQNYDCSCCYPVKFIWIINKIACLEGIKDRKPRYVTKSQHEAKAFLDNIHCAQDGWLKQKKMTIIKTSISKQTYSKM